MIKTAYGVVGTTTAGFKYRSRIKIRMKNGKIARLRRVEYHIISLTMPDNLDRVYMWLNKSQNAMKEADAVAASEAYIRNQEWENDDCIAKHVILGLVASAVGREKTYLPIAFDFPLPIEVSSDLTLFAMGGAGTAALTVGCTVYYDLAEAGKSKLLKSGLD